MVSKSLLEKRIEETNESKRAYAQEALIIDVAEQIWDIMEKKKIRKAKLAKALGHSAAYITQLLNGSRNMTLRSLADVATALDSTVHIGLSDASRHADWNLDAVQPIKTGTLKKATPVLEACNDNVSAIINFAVN